MSTLLHLTDTHLFADAGKSLKGIRPHDSFTAVLSEARRRFPKPDGIILGGDMAQDESAETYRRIADMLNGWHAPFMLTPGNHANIGELHSALIPALMKNSGYTDDLRLGNWQVIAMNSSLDGSIAGRLHADELERLEQLLVRGQNEHVLVALHHHPIEIDSRWLDEIGLLNSGRFWDVIKEHDRVKAVLCGHIHQELDVEYNGVRVLGTPSTCFQFRPGEEDFRMDNLSPGFRWLELKEDGAIDTGVERIIGFIPDDLNNTIPY